MVDQRNVPVLAWFQALKGDPSVLGLLEDLGPGQAAGSRSSSPHTRRSRVGPSSGSFAISKSMCGSTSFHGDCGAGHGAADAATSGTASDSRITARRTPGLDWTDDMAQGLRDQPTDPQAGGRDLWVAEDDWKLARL